MALIPAVTAAVAGTLVTYTAAAGGGDTVQFTTNTEFRVKNGSGSSMTVTVVIPGNTEFGQAAPDLPVVVAAGAERAILLTRGMVDTSTGLISITYSLATSVTVAVVQVP
jgi:hypothetical protein